MLRLIKMDDLSLTEEDSSVKKRCFTTLKIKNRDEKRTIRSHVRRFSVIEMTLEPFTNT